MSTYSNLKPGSTPTGTIKKYNVHEVITSLTDSKQVTNDLAASKRYPHRLTVGTVGNPNIAPYEPVYLAGLPNGLEGYWTVLSVTHIFNGKLAKYTLTLEVGTDVLGETNPNAQKLASTRDVQAEIAGKTLASPPEPALSITSTNINLSPIDAVYGNTAPTSVTAVSELAIPESMSTGMYSITPPNFTDVKQTASWIATSPQAVINVIA